MSGTLKSSRVDVGVFAGRDKEKVYQTGSRDGEGLMPRRTPGVCLERMLDHQQERKEVSWGDNGLV